MTGQRIGYIRVSTFDQNPERQLEGVKVDRAFSDKASGKDVKRALLQIVGGDKLIIPFC
ncbi:Resolvase, N terminal domain [Escherichia coli]|nr:transposase [Escherichia coli]